MNASSDLIFFLKQQEGLRLTAYPDGKGYSIGYGVQTYENGAAVKAGDTITNIRAEQLLNYHVGKAAAVVNKYVTVRLNQGQFDALVSFVYNVGEGQFRTSTLLKVINANPLDLTRIEAEFKRWIYSNGKVVNALVRRRQEEAYLYGQGTSSKDNSSLYLVAAAAAVGLYLYLNKAGNE